MASQPAGFHCLLAAYDNPVHAYSLNVMQFGLRDFCCLLSTGPIIADLVIVKREEETRQSDVVMTTVLLMIIYRHVKG